MKYQDVTGYKFHRLTTLLFDHNDGKHTYWLCQCDCGNKKVIRIDSIKSGKIKSCGCLPNRTKEDLSRKQFNRLLVVSFKEKRKNQLYWNCKCDCGKLCIVSVGALKNGRTKSCGCWREECKRLNCGERNYQWRQDLSIEDRNNDRRLCPKNKKWRKKVYKRDNYTCQVCNYRGSKLVAHHIYSYHSHRKLRYVTSNGITLCVTCHRMFHKKFGIKNNTRKQFNDFKRYKNANHM